MEIIEKEHSNIISPSSVGRSLICKASLIPPTKPIPEKTSPSADKGTRAHDLWSKLALKEISIDAVTEEQSVIDSATTFLSHTESLKKKIGPDNIVTELIEGKVALSESTFGTVDHAIMYIKNGENKLIVSELKTGISPVPAIKNPQLLTYAVCICEQFNWKPTSITLCVIQPPLTGSKPKVYTLPMAELKIFKSTLIKLEKVAIKIIAGDYTKAAVKEVVGNHCFFCKRKHECKAYRKESSIPGLIALDEADPLPVAVRKKGLPDIKLWSNEEIAKALYAFEYLEPLKTDLFELAKEKLRNREVIFGYKLVSGKKSRKLREELGEDVLAEELRKLGVKMPFRIKKSLKTIGDIEREIGKRKIEALTCFNSPQTQIAQESDPRPAVNNDSIAMAALSELEE